MLYVSVDLELNSTNEKQYRSVTVNTGICFNSYVCAKTFIPYIGKFLRFVGLKFFANKFSRMAI